VQPVGASARDPGGLVPPAEVLGEPGPGGVRSGQAPLSLLSATVSPVGNCLGITVDRWIPWSAIRRSARGSG